MNNRFELCHALMSHVRERNMGIKPVDLQPKGAIKLPLVSEADYYISSDFVAFLFYKMRYCGRKQVLICQGDIGFVNFSSP